MKVFVFSAATLFYLNASAQKIYLPKDLSATDGSLQNAMPMMARQIIPLYRDKNKNDSLENIFRYQLAAGQYIAATKSLDASDAFYGDTGTKAGYSGMQFRSYAVTKEAQKSNGKSFAALYADTLAALYNRLAEDNRGYATSFFYGDTVQLRKSLNDLLTKAAGKDSLELAEARALVRTYNSWNVYRQVLPLAKPVFIAEDSKRYNTQDNVLIAMPDGGQLSATIVRRIKDKAPLPVILMYNIYSDTVGDGYQASRAQAAAAKGYVSIILNTRGKKGSPQKIEPFEHDAQDAYYAIDWISKQPWCNGKIGMYGGSYLGFSQWSATKKLHPALKTIVPQVAVGIGIDYPSHNGVFMSYMLQWIHYVSNNKGTDIGEFRSGHWDSLYRAWYKSGRSFRALDTMDGRPNAIFQRWLNHPTHDRFWQDMVPYGKEFTGINIPVLTTTGYFDDDQRGAFYYMNEHLKWNKAAKHYLLIGPWNHGAAQSAAPPQISGYTLDKAAVININETVFKWFDHILKDSALPPMLKDNINFQVAGANEWRSAPSLKAASNDSMVFYLSNVRNKMGYKLSPQKPSIKASIAQEISYTDREAITPATADNSELATVDSALYVGEDLQFVSEPLKEDLIMSGSMEGIIKTTLNKKDIDLNVRLYQLLPDSTYFCLSRSLVRASYIKDRSKRQLLQPGKEETILITNAYYMCRKLVKGSRIVALVGIQKSPNWQINYGSGKDVSDETIADGAVPLQIEWSSSSYIKIPLLR